MFIYGGGIPKFGSTFWGRGVLKFSNLEISSTPINYECSLRWLIHHTSGIPLKFNCSNKTLPLLLSKWFSYRVTYGKAPGTLRTAHHLITSLPPECCMNQPSQSSHYNYKANEKKKKLFVCVKMSWWHVIPASDRSIAFSFSAEWSITDKQCKNNLTFTFKVGSFSLHLCIWHYYQKSLLVGR